MASWIHSIGTALPPNILLQHDAGRILADHSSKPQSVRALFARSGIEQRHSCVDFHAAADVEYLIPKAVGTARRMARYADEALPLALEASRRALRKFGSQPGDISHLVTVSCTGFSAPGVDCGLVDQLGLRRDVFRTHIGFMGCHGSFNGLRVARSICADNPANQVLLVAVEICSIHARSGGSADEIVGASLFADGAAACVLSPLLDRWRLEHGASYVVPDSQDCITWAIGDEGFEMKLAARTPSVIAAHIGPWVESTLGRYGLARQDIEDWVIHPGGPRIVKAVQQGLGLSDGQVEPSLTQLRFKGNMSSPSVLFQLERLAETRSGGPIAMLGFGPGLSCEMVLLLPE